MEIARALYTDASIIIMDEPTSAISDKEVENLYSIIGQFKAKGKTVVYISHKFRELFQLADRYIVLRDGATVDSGDIQDATQEGLIRKMTGREIPLQQGTSSPHETEVLLSVRNLTMKHASIKSKNLLENISLDLKKGEILGIYGLMGSGRSELMESIFGLHPKTSEGEILVPNHKTKISCAGDAIAAGIALVPEDRKVQGLMLHQSVTKNISISILRLLERAGIMLDRDKELNLARQSIQQLHIKTRSETTEVRNLSGGNQQKIVIAKWLATSPRILLLDEPTRGIDIKAKTEIYQLMRNLAVEGIGIIMVSSELPEILTVSDRVLVMCEGALTASLITASTNEQEILKYALHKN